MSYTIDQLRAFAVVAEELHFGRAAERLKISQPPLSRRIQLLERSLRVQLFDRSRRTIALTAAGRTFHADVSRVLGQLDAAEHAAQRASSGLRGTVHVGFTLIVGNLFLARLLRAGAEELPEVELVLHEMLTAQQPDALRASVIDLGMCRPDLSSGDLRSRPLKQDRLLVAVPRHCPLAEEHLGPEPTALPVMPLAALEGQNMIMYAADGPRYFRELVSSILTVHGVAPRPVQQIAEVYTMLRLVDAGLGAAVIPESTSSWRGPETVLFRVPELEPHPAESVLLWNEESRNPALSRVLQLASHLD